jgi:hypothetical protein
MMAIYPPSRRYVLLLSRLPEEIELTEESCGVNNYNIFGIIPVLNFLSQTKVFAYSTVMFSRLKEQIAMRFPEPHCFTIRIGYAVLLQIMLL